MRYTNRRLLYFTLLACGRQTHGQSDSVIASVWDSSGWVNLWSLLALPWYRANSRRRCHRLLFVLPGGQELQDYGVFQEHDSSGTSQQRQ